MINCIFGFRPYFSGSSFAHGLSNFRVIAERCKSTYFISTPIFYVNANPHIGHLYTAVIADAVARFQRMKKPDLNLKFMTGTDEHGLKISLSAKENKIDEKTYCDSVSQKYFDLFSKYNISYTDFLRTTEERHISTVIKLWNKIFENGYIYSGEYSGWYCTSDEAFVPEIFLEEGANGLRLTKDSRKPVHYIKELNYKFKLKYFQNDLRYWLNTGDVVKPNKFKKILQNWIENDEIMEDLSVSRPAMRVQWAIPVPNDPTQNIYVWLDALSSYLTSSGYLNSGLHWPPDLQIIGKDILKFHGIYWPAFLMAAELQPPKCILCHSHWLCNGEKMSKSKGNVVDPMKKLEDYTNDGLRYFLLRGGVAHSDGNFVESEVINIINVELADKLGNLLNRCCSQVINAQQIFPGYSSEHHNKYCRNSASSLIQHLEILPDIVSSHYEEFNFHKGIDEIVTVVSLTNKFFDDEKPWKIVKDSEQQNHLHAILHLTMESLRICGILLQPITPGIAENLLNRLAIRRDHRNFSSIRPFSWQRSDSSCALALLQDKKLLFPKIQASFKNK